MMKIRRRAAVAPLLPPRSTDLRTVVNAIFYRCCGWGAMATCRHAKFPPWRTHVYHYFKILAQR
jgi:hypothetical protein